MPCHLTQGPVLVQGLKVCTGQVYFVTTTVMRLNNQITIYGRLTSCQKQCAMDG